MLCYTMLCVEAFVKLCLEDAIKVYVENVLGDESFSIVQTVENQRQITPCHRHVVRL